MDEEYDAIVCGTGLTVCLLDGDSLSNFYLQGVVLKNHTCRSASLVECYPSVGKEYCIWIEISTMGEIALRLHRWKM